MQQPKFLPMTSQEMRALGWDAIDVLLITGDAYVDHPSFGVALIGRYLISHGFRAGIIAQPDWRKPDSLTILGRPRLFTGITAGAMDSMVANYTANKKLRRDDAYTPGGDYGFRPNRATIVYANLAKQVFPGLPVVLGGIEASLRRLAHYDYWEDKIRRSLLLDAKADILVYGMGEKPVLEIAQRLSQQQPLDHILQTAIAAGQVPDTLPHVLLPSYEQILVKKELLGQAALQMEKEHAAPGGRALVQQHANRFVIVHPWAKPMSTAELDAVYALPFARQAHPAYQGKIPALEPVANSIVSHRGCFGGCTFCALGAHQGKIIQSRSRASILAEARALAQLPSFHGTITDVGGPSANMYAMACTNPAGPCDRASCLYPSICRRLKLSHQAQLELLSALLRIPKVKHVFVASGIRYDLALEQPEYIAGLLRNGHVSGMLKIAPEHVEPLVLSLMRKPDNRTVEKFMRAYQSQAQKLGKPALATAYFIASFPGSSPASMEKVRIFAHSLGLRVEQMQDFIPLPMTLAGIMYHTGQNPWTGEPLKTAKTFGQRQEQRKALLGTGKKWRSGKRLPGGH